VDFGGPWDAAAEDFSDRNPDVMAELVELSHRWRNARPGKHWGIAAAFEILRWQRAMRTDDHNGDFKLNQNYRAWFARQIMHDHPDFTDIFRTRRTAA
jgi:hypothetical protein